MDLHTPPSSIAQGVWIRLRLMVLVHSLIGTVLVVAALRMRARPGPWSESPALPILFLAWLLWILPLFLLRRKAKALPAPSRPAAHAGGCLLTFLPLLQVGTVDLLPRSGRPWELLTLMIQGNALALVWVLIAGFCFLITEIPVSGTLWASLLGNVGITLVWLCVMALGLGL